MATTKTRARRPVVDAEKAAEEKAAKLAAIHATLDEAVASLTSSDQWLQMLVTASRFHRYSLGNMLLIMRQRPDATRVAGFNTWRDLGRTVRKGEKGIAIFAPVVYKVPTEDGDEVKRISTFRIVYVFDVAQTEGEPLAGVEVPPLLDGEAPAGLWDGLVAQAVGRGYTVERGDTGKAEGWTDPQSLVVCIREGGSDAQAVKVLAHEVAHIMLGHADPGFAYHAHRGVAEVEAESVAHIVTAARGLDAPAGSAYYVAGWAGSDPKKVKETATAVLATASAILAALDG